MATKGYSLHIGVNHTNPDHYKNLATLSCCVNDANYMHGLAQQYQYAKTALLLNEEATCQKVRGTLRQYSRELEPGDIFLLTYSGHGGQVQDENWDEEDAFDETWCLYDRQLLDDELYHELAQFKEGVRVLVFSDSCHSGTITKAGVEEEQELKDALAEMIRNKGMNVKWVPLAQLADIFRENAALYSQVQQDTPATRPGDVSASVKLFSACLDNQVAREGQHLSRFTDDLRRLLESGRDIPDYASLYRALLNDAFLQTPNYFEIGPRLGAFDNSPPFVIGDHHPPRTIDASPRVSEEVELLLDFDEEEAGLDEGTLEELSKDYSLEGWAEGTKGEGKEDTTKSLHKSRRREEKEWDLAYQAFGRLREKHDGLFVEPNFNHAYYQEHSRKSKSVQEQNAYLNSWPSPASEAATKPLSEFSWFLEEGYTELKGACERIMKDPKLDKKIRIAHIDTGYIPSHISTPENILRGLGASFVKKERHNRGVDLLDNRRLEMMEQDGHGMATLAILAGGKVELHESYGGYSGYLGAIPFAEIIPIRISDNVALFSTKAFAKAIDYAIKHGCEVVTMSMAGLPSRKWARAIDRAYERGVTVVTAAGNSWRKGMMRIAPNTVLYPARFHRVLAATGACINQEPYDFEANSWLRGSKTAGGEDMQGNWGPRSAMETALAAAYTPNLPWAAVGQPFAFSRSGGGTSSATPQVAAAAALWILGHREELQQKGYSGTWKQVEAVREALFRTADKSYPEYRKYYGQGILRARQALEVSCPDITDDIKKRKAKGSFIPILVAMIRRLLSKKKKKSEAEAAMPEEEMMSLEILQLIHRDPQLFPFAERINLEDPDKPLFEEDGEEKSFIERVMASELASDFLKRVLRE